MEEVVIVDAARSAVGRKKGSLGQVHPTDTLGAVMQKMLERSNVPSEEVDQVIGGCINKLGAQGMNVARTAWLSHGGAEATPCITIDSQCGSSQEAVHLATSMLRSGMADCVVACGVENMTRLPVGSDAVGLKKEMGKPVSRSYFEHYEFTSQFEGAERMAEKYQVTRADSDAFGLQSQERAKLAVDGGYFDSQIIPLEVNKFDEEGNRLDETFTFAKDEIPRDTSLDALAELKPVAREDGIHTAGTSSQIADGAAAVLMMTASKAEALGVKPLAKVVDAELVGCDPVLMLEGPIPATEKMLEKTGLNIDDIDVFEVNEAFASVVLSWAKTVGADMAKVNPNGGAISLGHPLGATGCFLTTKAVHELHRTGGEYGLIAMCCGGGLGTGTIIQKM
ncbi:MAG: acetyl-CoA C-acyltransferase [Pseudomonadales bacterium]|nr:acetyl-CoA C-acyltransferase [Pseudomonadales bacterium]MBO6595856.1 acetyl-CoA C-acyltransferase [Pseudomonadales bacterium]MBO6656721.1 acetyl-CoA C-acyltransferase [Pseudomonadales bacterium]MBO6702461.1 acetyl-CoA C-acyltransferase [Pseudomonadales bacterium]MBO6822340.1 acetyl-CoA C-acyltransferase [Pseudomonadales bacterium]